MPKFPYECDECGKGFVTEVAERGHRSQHSDDTPFVGGETGEELVTDGGSSPVDHVQEARQHLEGFEDLSGAAKRGAVLYAIDELEKARGDL